MIGLLKSGYGGEKHDFLIVQSAGNGKIVRFDQIGIDAEKNGWFASINRSIFAKVYRKSDYSYDDVRGRIMIVGAVFPHQEDNGCYSLTKSSNFGTAVDICAPGEYIFTTSVADGANNVYVENFNGTSAAAPMVSGSVALLWSLAPDLTAKEVRNILIENRRTNAIDENGSQYPMLATNLFPLIPTTTKSPRLPKQNKVSA